jgi:hypothetical protein
MKLASILAGAALLCAVAASAEAKVYDFSFTGDGVSGSGAFTTADSNSPSAITGITGSITDSFVGPGVFTITGLSPYASADNNLFPAGQPYIDFGGVSFTTDIGGEFNFATGGGGAFGQELLSSILNPVGYANGGVDNPGAVNISLGVTAAGAVPEPATWAAMLLGFGGIGAAMRSARRKQAVLA